MRGTLGRVTTESFMVTSYRTLLRAVETESEVKRSRFICYLMPVASEGAARSSIAEIRSLHPKARHHCSAFIIGPGQELQRTNDDGEPSGTAGAPMLDALLGAGLSDVVAVVVRYFGGTLLGAGGLTRAYRASVAQAVEAAELIIRELRATVEVSSDYAAAAVIEAEARRLGWGVVGSEYTSEVLMTLSVPPGQLALLRERVAELTAGTAVLSEVGLGYVAI
ncbi:YigZ family protein [Lysinibacter sp. HNR]|uniref:YigZ family protein n=1 Tax=Lysinibacter sp. HNR TaxID=3031408 RepID=UPI002434CD7A|nr:YigZ family protein [Lysinibacter sp. HNR]WGD37702.1 YigZ family protein [Lysinibacter sp. HNR]